MAEYIEREAAISKLRLVEIREAIKNFPAAMLAELKSIPAADVCPYYVGNKHDRGDDSLCHKAGCEVKDVRPVRHGRWVGEYDGYADGYPVYDMWYCSECGWDCDGADEEPTWNYCPNCGADMREAGQ